MEFGSTIPIVLGLGVGWPVILGAIFLLLLAVGGTMIKNTSTRRHAGLDYFGGERREYESEDDGDGGGGT